MVQLRQERVHICPVLVSLAPTLGRRCEACLMYGPIDIDSSRYISQNRCSSFPFAVHCVYRIDDSDRMDE